MKEALLLLLKASVFGVFCVTFLGLFGHQIWWADLFNHFRIHMFLAAILLFVGLMILRCKKWAIFIGLPLLLHGYFISTTQPWLSPKNIEIKNATTILSANLLAYRQPSLEIIQTIQKEKPDYVLLLEYTPAWASSLEILKKDYPYFIEYPADGPFGLALFGQKSFEGEIFYLPTQNTPYIQATLANETLFYGLHTKPPIGQKLADQRNQLMAHVATQVQKSSHPTLVMGDLNDTVFSIHFRQFMKNSHLRNLSHGWQPTWPSGLGKLGIQIDHALGKNVSKWYLDVLTDMGSDHRPILLSFQP